MTVAKESTDIKINENAVKTEVNNYIEKNEKELEEYVPVLEQARTIVKQIKLSKIVARTLTLSFIIIFTAVILIIALIIAAALAVLSIMFFAALRYINSIPPKIGDTSDVITSPCSSEQ